MPSNGQFNKCLLRKELPEAPETIEVDPRRLAEWVGVDLPWTVLAFVGWADMQSGAWLEEWGGKLWDLEELEF